MKKEEVKTNSRKDYITLLSVISAFAVLVLHSNTCYWTYSKDRFWFTANIIVAVFYFAVPVFYMITGANLLDYQDKYSTKEYFKRRAKKALIPYLVWSIIMLFYLIATKHYKFSDISFVFMWNGLMNGKILSYYWFFAPLFCIYLCIPLFASVEKSKRKKVYSYLVIAAFVLNIFIPFASKLFNLYLSTSVNILVCANNMIYPLIGYLLDKYDLQKRDRIIIYILGIIGLLAHIIGTYVLSAKAGILIDTFKGYCNLPCLLSSVSVFLFIKELCKRVNLPKIFNKLSKYTFEFYLMHYVVIDLFRLIFKPDIRRIWFRTTMPFIVIPVVILITWLLRKIPIVKKIVP